jgi:predicted cupin superfamily sugar epimerase
MTKVDELIEVLKLKVHPESGYFRETYRSKEVIDDLPNRYQGGSRNFGTSILYLLAGNQFSTFHKIRSDEIWHYHLGCPLNLYVITRDGSLKTLTLGNDLIHKGHFQIVVERDSWFAAQPQDPQEFTLAGCTVAPGFDFSDFQIAEKKEMLKKFPQHSSLINAYTY